jgi:hypothetical protein
MNESSDINDLNVKMNCQLRDRTFSFLSIYYQNVRGLRTKTEQLIVKTSDGNFDVLAFSETWLNVDILSSELFLLHQYTVFRCDRRFDLCGKLRGGGVLLAVRSNYLMDSIDMSAAVEKIPSIDIVGVKISFSSMVLYIFCVYVPPNTSLVDYEIFFDTLSEFCLNLSSIVLVGDFNLSNSSDTVSSKGYLLHDFTAFLNFRQCNNIANAHGNILDLVLTDMSEHLSLQHSIPILDEDSHHPAILIELKIIAGSRSNFSNSSKSKTYNFRRANFPFLYSLLSEVDWSFIYSLHDVNEVCTAFYGKLYSLFDKSVPCYTHNHRHYPRWYTHELKCNIRSKERCYRKYKKFKKESDREEYVTLRRLVKTRILRDYNTYVSQVENSLRMDPKMFWSYVHDRNSVTRIPAKMTYSDVSCDRPQDIVNSFADYFMSVYSTSSVPGNIKPQSYSNSFWPCLTLKNFDKSDIEKAFEQLKPKISYGSDNIPAFLVKDCRSVFLEPLVHIFNLSLEQGTFPNVWKSTKVLPVHKTGNSAEIKNYRPIALLSTFSKIFEIAIFNFLSPVLKNILTPSQHGFMRGRSTVTNLVCVTQFISDSLDRRGQVDVIYTDVAKAFDSVDHHILLYKLSEIGVHGFLLDWFLSYLTERKQFVSYNGFSSREYIQMSGVPQGSVLGPLLFNIYINDIVADLECRALLFADDLKIYRQISSMEDCIKLQDDLIKVNEWCTRNQLSLNIDKCTVVSHSRKAGTIIYEYTCGKIILPRSSSQKDLGVSFDVKLSFENHVQRSIDRGYKMLGFVLRNSRSFKSVEVLKTLYFSLVRSGLEYATTAWAPYYIYMKAGLERVQRRFLKHLFHIAEGHFPPRGLDHAVLLQKYCFIHLQCRRDIADARFLVKLIRGQLDCPELLEKIPFRVPRSNLRIKASFIVPRARTNVLASSPLNRILKLGNLLEDEVDLFKCSIKEVTEAVVLCLE